MRVDEYFEHMKKVVHGTKYVPLEYEEQFGKNYYGGKGYQCPHCKIGFTGQKTTIIKCPCCDYEFYVRKNDNLLVKQSGD